MLREKDQLQRVNGIKSTSATAPRVQVTGG